MKFSRGDIVTRIGTDKQEVLDINEDGDLMLVRCIKAPHDGFCCVGDEEWNLLWRYSKVKEDEDAERNEKCYLCVNSQCEFYDNDDPDGFNCQLIYQPGRESCDRYKEE